MNFFKKKKQQFFEEKIKHILHKGYKTPDKIQRHIEEDRIEELDIDFDKDHLPYVPLYFCVLDKQRYIVDGQHRLKIYKNNPKYHGEHVWVSEIQVDSFDEIFEIFKIINNRLALNDMWTKSQTVKEIISETFEYFEKEYPNAFKFKGIRRPYLNRELFRTQLTLLQEEFPQDTSQELIDKILYINRQYSVKCADYFPSKGKTSNLNILKTLEKNNCLYLGMVEEWLRHCKEGKIPLQLSDDFRGNRAKVWEKYMGNVAKGKCWCCEHNQITAFNFEAGHVIARARGGSDELVNLRPICSYCNKTMGTENMKDFKAKC